MNPADDPHAPRTHASGMGGPERGPSFTSDSFPLPRGDAGTGSTPLGLGPLPVPPTPGPPPASKVPALVTLGVVLVVVLVSVVATVGADRGDARPQVVTASSVPASAAPTPPRGSIDFTSTRGSGRLRIVEHTWQTVSDEASSRLVIDIEITCSSGRVDYDPYAFQAFDDAGQLYDVAPSSGQVPLGVGNLDAGESARGLLEFEIPRGEVTLLMSHDNFGSITALRIDA